MPQALWEALLRDAVQSLRPPYTPQALRQWLQTTRPQAWAAGSPPHAAPPATTTPGRGRTRAREGQGAPRSTQARGHRGAPSEGRHSQGQDAGSDTTWGQETTQEPGRGGSGDQDKKEKGTTAGTTTHTQEREHHHGGTSAAPPPPNTPTHTNEVNIGRHADHTSAHPPATGNHTENGGHTYTGRTGHTHRGSRTERRRTAHHHALTARRRPRPPQGPPHRHRKRTKARPRHQGLGTETPRGHGTKAQAPREGNPTDRHAIDLPDPPARAARPSPHSTDPARHQHLTAPPSPRPATLRPALRTTTQTRLTSTDPPRHYARPRHTAPQRATVQRATARRNATRHRAPQHDTTDPNLKD